MAKQDQLREWLEDNPGKTKRDWLLEVRCPDEKTRQEFAEFLNFCDENGIELWIPSIPKFTNGKQVSFDFEVKGFGAYYDLDTPDELYTGKNGYSEVGWRPFLSWKIQQVMNENPDYEPVRGFVHKVAPGHYEIRRGDRRELEENFPFFKNSVSQKWNNPEVLETLKKWAEAQKKWAEAQKK